ncbi:kinase-like protein [Eremomyces bilateralis CBS 781.70]|uniref:Kinase-like protein n=1 Tax=Eremomyces bilateralis CBS 781.70 TaxID=1392243 RepID=A0A6G1GHE5_9PEZI|nr:kinase-like protein [Eremomyces bilateralis CBS 781.70]KAF1817290.1 kinase-like protein [Eremomyces bilateralis CBS 781.70]
MPFRPFRQSRLKFPIRVTRPQSSVAKSLSLEVPIEEERLPFYKWKDYYHPNPGDVLNKRYKLKVKLGWGTSSTVWLAQDIGFCNRTTGPESVAIKISTNNVEDEDAHHELDISTRIARTNPHHEGRSALLVADDHFTIDTANGSHVCLVFEPMRESIWLFKRGFSKGNELTPSIVPLFKTYLRIVLSGLDYLHSECKLIHTDLKLDNILMTFEDRPAIDRFIQAQTENPMARKVFTDHTVYRSQRNFGDIKWPSGVRNMMPKLADFGVAQRGDQPGRLIFPIQPNHCRAPEVLLGAGWSYSADIWNFGIIVWDLLAGTELFLDPKRTGISYSAAHHLAEMIALLGPAPESLIQRARSLRRWRWHEEIQNPEGKLCKNVAEFFGGPFYSSDAGEFLHDSLIPSQRVWVDEVPKCILDEDKTRFLRFIRRMLCWDPDARPTAKELVHDPWLDVKVRPDD